jgi:hypothetical protein
VDACQSLESALRLLAEEPSAPQANAMELDLRRLYAVALAHVHGFAAEPLQENLHRAIELAELAARAEPLFELRYALTMSHAYRGDYAIATAVCAHLRADAADLGGISTLRAGYVAGVVALWRGDLVAAEELFTPVRRAAVAAPVDTPWFGVDPALGAASHDSVRLLVVGDRDRALDAQNGTIEAAERLGHPFTLVQALTLGAGIFGLAGRWERSEALATAALAVASDHDFRVWAAFARLWRGRARAERGDVAGIGDMREEIATLHRERVRLGGSALYTALAGGCLRLGRGPEGIVAADEGLALCRDTGERLFESELWALRGELLERQADLASGHPERVALLDQADAARARALTLAREQGARGLVNRLRRHRGPPVAGDARPTD